MYLGIDLGTSSVKSILMDADQQVIAATSAGLTVQRLHHGWSEQDPESWWAATCQTLEQLSAENSAAFSQIKGIGLSGQMHGATLLNKDNEVLYPAILWNDSRSEEQCKTIEAYCKKSRELSGNIAMPGFTAPKVLWLKENRPEIFDQITKVLLPKDYLRFRLTGEFVSEMSDASNQSHMPDLVEGSEPSAMLRSDLQKKWGIAQSVVIAGGAGDNAAAACGMGTVKLGQAFLSLGTSGVLFVCNDKFSPNTDSAVHAFAHAVPNTWHQMGVILSATDSLQWLSGITGRSGSELTSTLGNTPRSVSSSIFLPYLGGERTPHNDARATGVFCGLTHSHGINEMTQTVLEGVAYAFKDNQAALKQAGTDFESAFAVGGGSQSEIWLKIIASIIERPLLIPKGGEQGAAFGAARLGLCATENLDPREICHVPKVERVVEPITAFQAQYQQGYARYKALCPAIKKVQTLHPSFHTFNSGVFTTLSEHPENC